MINNQIHNSLLFIENYGPLIVIFFSILELYKKKFYLIFFIFGSILNTIINLFLKYIIRQPRPKIYKIDYANQLGYIYSIDKYGMPSGHAQNLGFSLGFMYFFIKDSYLSYFFIVITFLTLYQRFMNNKHSIIQLILGLIIGLIFGIITFSLANHYIKGNLNIKKDDNAIF